MEPRMNDVGTTQLQSVGNAAKVIQKKNGTKLEQLERQVGLLKEACTMNKELASIILHKDLGLPHEKIEGGPCKDSQEPPERLVQLINQIGSIGRVIESANEDLRKIRTEVGKE